ncbi:glycosyltransferase family 25 protein [Providencia vermicola]
MESNIPIFIVSLKKDIERRKKITDSLSAQKLSWVMIDAVEGKDLPSDYLNSLNFQYNKPSCANEVACSLSHQLIYKKIVNSNYEWAIILEDDAIISDKLSDLVKQLNNEKTSLLKKNNIYLLGGQEGLNSRKRLSLSFFNKIKIGNVVFRKVTYKPSKLFRTCCYLIHRDECEKLITLFDKAYYVADSWNLFYKLKIVDGYFLTEIIEHPILTLENSNIEKYRITEKKTRRQKGFIESKISLFFLQIRKFFR